MDFNIYTEYPSPFNLLEERVSDEIYIQVLKARIYSLFRCFFLTALHYIINVLRISIVKTSLNKSLNLLCIKSICN